MQTFLLVWDAQEYIFCTVCLLLKNWLKLQQWFLSSIYMSNCTETVIITFLFYSSVLALAVTKTWKFKNASAYTFLASCSELLKLFRMDTSWYSRNRQVYSSHKEFQYNIAASCFNLVWEFRISACGSFLMNAIYSAEFMESAETGWAFLCS